MKNTPVDFLKLRIQALLLVKISQSDRDIIEHWYQKAKDMEREEIEAAYMAVRVEDVETNEKANNFTEVYWGRIEKIQKQIDSLEEVKTNKARVLKEEKEVIEKQIAIRQKRLNAIK